jgi:hypothetical protein
MKFVAGAGLAAIAGCSMSGNLAPAGQAVSSFSDVREAIPVTVAPSGVYIGAQVNPADGRSATAPDATPQELEAKTEALEKAIGRKLALHLQYRDWKAMVEIGKDVGIRDDMVNGRVPVISWTCADDAGSSKWNLLQIIGGRADADIRKIVLQLESLKDAAGKPYPFILRYFWEFNINATGGGGADANGNGGCFVPATATKYTNPQQFKLAWDHIWQIFNAAQPKLNVAFDWNPNITHDLYVDPATYYPNPSEVDWIGIDGYNKKGDNGKPVGFSAIFTPLYTEFTGNKAYFGNKPIMVGETGSCGEYTFPNDQASFLESIAREVGNPPAQFPDIHAINYFDAPGQYSGCTWSLTSAGTAEFAKLAALPYFSHRITP